MKVVILCGGKGTRYDIERPKALAMIGDKPIIQHVMEIYCIQGFNSFILATGWKGENIEDYFRSLDKKFDIIFVDTGIDSNTGQRVKLIEDYIPKEDKNFFCTYSDGIANIDMYKLLARHTTYKNIITITAVRPYHQFGIIKFDDNDNILGFEEKPRMNEYINGGFFVFNKKIFDNINEKNNEELEKHIFLRILSKHGLGTYKHEEFWDTLNTQKDEIRLNELYNYSINNNTKLDWYDI